MAKTFIRVYCNDTKVRSTGGSPWWWRGIIKELTALPEQVKDNCFRLIDTYITHTPGVFRRDYRTREFRYKIEIVKSRPTGKEIVSTIECPWHLERKYYSDFYLVYKDTNIRYKVPRFISLI